MGAMDGDAPITLFREPGWRGSRRSKTSPSFAGNNVVFDRHELSLILDLYGAMVASGHWRDYALEYSERAAVFAIYRHAFDRPIFRIVKRRQWMRHHGTFTVLSASGEIVGHGSTLAAALGSFRRYNLQLVDGRAKSAGE